MKLTAVVVGGGAGDVGGGLGASVARSLWLALPAVATRRWQGWAGPGRSASALSPFPSGLTLANPGCWPVDGLDTRKALPENPMPRAPLLYLDWNVIADFAAGDQLKRHSLLLGARRAGLVELPFSIAHIMDLHGLRAAQDGRSRGDLIRDALDVLAVLSGPLFLSQDLGPGFDFFTAQNALHRRMPHDVWATMASSPGGIRLSLGFADWFKLSRKDAMLAEHGFTPATLNNIKSPDHLVAELNRLLSESAKAHGFSPAPSVADVLNHPIENLPDTVTNRALRLSSLLNSFGYFSDKGSALVSRSGMVDAMHVSQAVLCDAFCTAERRLRSRTPMAYSLCGSTTRVMDTAELDDLLDSWCTEYGLEPADLDYENG